MQQKDGDRWDCMQLFLDLDPDASETQTPEIVDGHIENLFAEQLEITWDQSYDQEDSSANWVITDSSQNCTISEEEINLKPGNTIDFK